MGAKPVSDEPRHPGIPLSTSEEVFRGWARGRLMCWGRYEGAGWTGPRGAIWRSPLRPQNGGSKKGALSLPKHSRGVCGGGPPGSVSSLPFPSCSTGSWPAWESGSPKFEACSAMPQATVGTLEAAGG